MVKITGPGAPPPPPSLDQTQGVEKTGGKEFAEKVDRTSGPSAAQGPQASQPTGAPSGALTGDIGAQLERGEITAEAAVDQVVDRVLDKALGPDAPANTRGEVETALRGALETDPQLAKKVKSLQD